jgi:predicted metal-dependent hydrolase
MQLSLPLADDAWLDEGTPSQVVVPRIAPAAPPATTVETRSTGDGADPGSISFVRRRRARRYVLRVDAEGIVRVTIPRGGSRREAVDFVERHRTWIDRQRRRIRPPSLSAADLADCRARAETELPPRLLALAARHDLQITRISIRNQRTRWGSCGRNGHITLNWRVILMPEWVADYVLVHELMHLRRLDHSPAYWALVAAACPRFRDARRWLRDNAERLR